MLGAGIFTFPHLPPSAGGQIPRIPSQPCVSAEILTFLPQGHRFPQLQPMALLEFLQAPACHGIFVLQGTFHGNLLTPEITYSASLSSVLSLSSTSLTVLSVLSKTAPAALFYTALCIDSALFFSGYYYYLLLYCTFIFVYLFVYCLSPTLQHMLHEGKNFCLLCALFNT